MSPKRGETLRSSVNFSFTIFGARQMPTRQSGEGILLNVLPRAAVVPGDGSSLLIMGGPNDKEPSFFNVPAETTEAKRYGPTVVSPSGTVMANFTVEQLG